MYVLEKHAAIQRMLHETGGMRRGKWPKGSVVMQ